MKIEVWTEPEPKPEVEKVVRTRLRQGELGAYVEAVNVEGNVQHGGSLLRVGQQGVHRMRGIDPALGFPLDDKGRVVLVGED